MLFRVMKHHAILFFFIPRNEYGRCASPYGQNDAQAGRSGSTIIFPECDHSIAKMMVDPDLPACASFWPRV